MSTLDGYRFMTSHNLAMLNHKKALKINFEGFCFILKFLIIPSPPSVNTIP